MATQTKTAAEKTAEEIKSDAKDVKNAAANAAEDVKSNVKEVKNAAERTAEEIKSEVTEGVEDVANSAREFVQRTAAAAKERTDSAYEGVTKFNDGLEKTMNRMVVGYVGLLSEIADASHENAVRALTTVEKIANAKSLSEAAQIQVDYIRENISANYDPLLPFNIPLFPASLLHFPSLTCLSIFPLFIHVFPSSSTSLPSSSMPFCYFPSSFQSCLPFNNFWYSFPLWCNGSALGPQPRGPGFDPRAEWKNLGGFSDTLMPLFT